MMNDSKYFHNNNPLCTVQCLVLFQIESLSCSFMKETYVL